MATKISSDISTKIDITARKNDSFYLQATVTDSNNSAFNLTDYNTIEFVIKNRNNSLVKVFSKGGNAATETTEVNKVATVTDSGSAGVITINVKATTVTTNNPNVTFENMNIQAGNYEYSCKIESSTETHTILHGKFKVID